MNPALTYDRIKVVCQYPIEKITELQFTGRFNEHGEVLIKGIIKDSEKSKCIESSSAHDLVQVFEQSETGDELLFSGIVSSIQVKHTGGIYYIEIEGLSYTYLLDNGLKCRSFQDKNMAYSTLIREVTAGYSKADFIQLTKDQPTGAFILQYKETDWTFLKRIASHFQTVIIPDIMGAGPRFWIGIHKQPKKLEQIINFKTRKDTKQYQLVKSCSMEVEERDFIKYEVVSYTRLLLGDCVSFQGKDCIVECVTALLQNGIMCYQYVLGNSRGSTQPLISNGQIQGVSLLGEILEARNQEVKIKLQIDEKQDCSKACWFPYASQANNVLYCMPEKGTSISLYFPNADETSCIAVNAVRRNGGNCSKTSKPSMKYLGIPSGQEFKLGDIDIDFVAKEELYLNMDSGNGIQIQSHKDLNIFSDKKLMLEAQKAFKVFTKNSNLVVATGEEAEKTQLYLMNGADGDANVFSEKQIIYDGRYHQVLEDRLNAEIKYEETKFDFWKSLGCALLAVAAVAVVVVAVVATGGAALAAVGICATKLAIAAIGTAVVFAGAKVIDDWYNDETSGFLDYLKAAASGALTGALIFAAPILAGKFAATSIGGAILSFAPVQIGLAVLKGYALYSFGKVLFEEGQNVYNFFVNGIPFNPSRLFKIAGTAAVAYTTNFVKDPVDVLTGVMVYKAVDFELPGPVPLTWSRTWYSDSQLMGQLGHSMRHNFEMGLDAFEDEKILTVYLEDGREILYPYLFEGEEFFSYQAKRLLRREADYYLLFDPETRYTYRFVCVSGGYVAYKLISITDEQGHGIQLEYDTQGYLLSIIDSAKRRLSVTTNERGQVIQVAYNQDVLVQYRYSAEHDLIEIVDAMGESSHLKYQNHLIVQKIDRNKHSFYWKYEYWAPGARVIKTWGDEGIIQGTFVYHDDEFYTELIDSLGGVREFHYDERNVPVKLVYGDMTQTMEKYDDRFELIHEVDEEGRLTAYTYNDWSQITSITRPDGTKWTLDYDQKGRLIQSTDPEGSSCQLVYNEDGTIGEFVDQTGTPTRFAYNEDKLIDTVTNIKGDTIHMTYNQDLNLTKVTLPDGTASQWDYDNRGNCIMAVNPLGAVEKYQYDFLNRLVRAKTADGNMVELKYNGYDDIIYAKDNQTEVSFTYTPLGNITSRKQKGKVVQYKYDIEEQLIAVINEKGEVYEFERDVKGNITKEVSFDKVVRTYVRDQSGLVKKICRPGGRFTEYQHDKLKNVIRVDYFDKTWDSFFYNKNGELMEATNGNVTVRYERNQVGLVTREWQNDDWIASDYDEVGNRIQVSSSMGAKIAVARNQMGQASHMAAAQNGESAWISKMTYNEIGQETMRLLPGNVVSTWQYDINGRPIYHHVSSQNHDTRRRKYSWNMNHRLKSITDELIGKGIIYSYNEFSDLIQSQNTDFSFLHREVDEVGNLYETKDKSDRIYGEGSRLLQSKVDTKELRNEFQGGFGRLVSRGKSYTYDEEGNLIQKLEPNGNVWKYEYFGNGMLSKVIKPDKSEVTFKYDSLGRRVEKCSGGKIIRFIWDGNTHIHEWEKEEGVKTKVNESLVTWLFDDGFIPVAKITNEGNYSIISDHLGTPVEAYDKKGNQVWSAELDIYGRVKKYTGEKEFIPFRYQGQYDDGETGLYYNRFRYYSPAEGMYTQPDPIGLCGGNSTLYAYVKDSNIRLDPLGLEQCRLTIKDKEAMGKSPSDMKNPHRHHIVRENAPKSWKPENQKWITEAQKWLKDVGIDINRDPANFTWAQNGGGNHTIKMAKFIYDFLKPYSGDKKAMIEALTKLGKLID